MTKNFTVFFNTVVKQRSSHVVRFLSAKKGAIGIVCVSQLHFSAKIIDVSLTHVRRLLGKIL